MLTDFQTRLLRTACHCTTICYNRNLVREKWYTMLSHILSNWNVSVEMDLHEAIKYMIDVSGVCDSNPSHNCDFWFLNSLNYQELCANGPQRDRVYYVTIAIFETLNYWCWHSAPLPITLNMDTLATILKEGKVYIDFSAYTKYRKFSLLKFYQFFS